MPINFIKQLDIGIFLEPYVKEIFLRTDKYSNALHFYRDLLRCYHSFRRFFGNVIQRPTTLNNHTTQQKKKEEEREKEKREE